ncbi:hypothetical protein GYMLUDRAFT_982366 [Collybiopsis luxurians FD-317 M1]|uniref:Unplaced genomic scaffold GYMLUscaffold_120, whole genome shotgun sequence n=1 Tax=Collybiopsis luxurians FD-317 M1 TaxID=944289 RepID=A0A0D0C8Y0_9AGAR|nr:hypothetical protein GYMLUDRAFT_982366 [Collybiopsis luxurians FD-317 M1]
MFRVFERFNALFVRPKIRGAIQEYQTQLIDSVKEDIKHLHDKLLTYMKHIEDVLGKGWELYAEGQKLQSESTAFCRKLDTRGAWLTDIQRCNMGVEAGGPSDATSINVYQLAVNFDLQTITLIKETRNLLWLSFSIPHSITSMAKDAKRIYPHAVSLMETIRTYGQTLALIECEQQLDSEPGIESLMAEWCSETQKMISKGINIKWDYFVNQYDTGGRFGGGGAMDGKDNRHVQFVREFAGVVSVLQDKTNSCISLYSSILHSIADLSTCSYTTDAFSSHLKKIQGAIDCLNLDGYSNLDWWVAELDKRIEKILLGRLENVIEVWCNEFQKTAEGDEGLVLGSLKKRHGQGAGQHGAGSKEDKFMETHMTIKPFVHEIRIQNQVIFLDPPIEHTRAAWIKQLHDWLGVVCHLCRIQSSRYEISLQMQSSVAGESNYTSLLVQLPSSTLPLAFSLIERKVSQLHSYVLKWFQFQSLWDLEAEYVFLCLGDSLAHWQQLLTEIKKARSMFDTTETQKSFGPFCAVDNEQVQARVNAKYDAWQGDILTRFGVKLGNKMKEMHASILKARNDLEHQSIEGLVGGQH